MPATQQAAVALYWRAVIPTNSSSIELKSNVELHLEQGALLKAHSDISTYFNPNGDDASVAAVSGAKAVDRPVAKPAYTFIHAKDADNFSITGQGAVDGNVYAFMKRQVVTTSTVIFTPVPPWCMWSTATTSRSMT